MDNLVFGMQNGGHNCDTFSIYGKTTRLI